MKGIRKRHSKYLVISYQIFGKQRLFPFEKKYLLQRKLFQNHKDLEKQRKMQFLKYSKSYKSSTKSLDLGHSM